MNRFDFIRKLVRYLLLGLIVLIVLALGKKIVTGKDCSVCPGKGICRGETDCSKFNSEPGTKPVKAPPLQKENGFI